MAVVHIAGVLLLTTAGTALAQNNGSNRQSGHQEEVAPIKVFTRQDATLVVTLQDALRVALDESFDIYRLKEKYLQLSYGLEAAERSLRTRIEFDSTLPRIEQGFISRLYWNDFDGILDLAMFEDSINSAWASLNVVQPLITNGTITLSSTLKGYERLMEKRPGPLTKLRYVQPKLSIRYNQPLFQYNSVKGQLREAELNFESLNLSYGEVELSRMNEVIQEFYTLFREQRLLEIANETFLQSVDNYETGNRKYQLGLISEMDKLSLEVDMVNSRDRLESAQNELEEQQLDFNRKVGFPVEERIWVETEEEYHPIEIDLNRALQLAFEKRSDRRQSEIELERAELELQKVRSEARPDLQLNLGYDFAGNSTWRELEWEDSWSKHLNASFSPDNMGPYTNVTVTLKVPIFDWGMNNSKVQRLISEQRVLRRESDEVEQNLYRDVVTRVGAVESSMRRMEMQEKNRRVAEQGYRISQERFEEGEISYIEHLLVQQRYLQTETLFTNALIEYEIAKAELREITMWDWETNRPVQQRTTPPKPFEKER